MHLFCSYLFSFTVRLPPLAILLQCLRILPLYTVYVSYFTLYIRFLSATDDFLYGGASFLKVNNTDYQSLIGELTYGTVIPAVCSSYKTKKAVSNTIKFVSDCCSFLGMQFHLIDFGSAAAYISYMKKQVGDGVYSRSTARTRASTLARTGSVFESLELIHGWVNPFKGAALSFSADAQIRTQDVPDFNAMSKILTSCSDGQLYLILCYAMKCGLSTSELRSIRITDLISSGGKYFIAYPLPSDRYRYVEIPDDVASLTEKFLSVSALSNTSGFLFTNKNGGQLSERSLEIMVKKYMKSIGLDFTIQSLRNSAIAILLATKGSTVGSVCSYFNITPTWIFRYRDIAMEYIDSASSGNSPIVNSSMLNVSPEWLD